MCGPWKLSFLKRATRLVCHFKIGIYGVTKRSVILGIRFLSGFLANILNHQHNSFECIFQVLEWYIHHQTQLLIHLKLAVFHFNLQWLSMQSHPEIIALVGSPPGGPQRVIFSGQDVWDRCFHLIQVWRFSDWVSPRTLFICFRISLLFIDESAPPDWWLPTTLNPKAQTIQSLTTYHLTFLPHCVKCEILFSQEFLYGCAKHFLFWCFMGQSLSRWRDPPCTGAPTTFRFGWLLKFKFPVVVWGENYSAYTNDN